MRLNRRYKPCPTGIYKDYGFIYICRSSLSYKHVKLNIFNKEGGFSHSDTVAEKDLPLHVSNVQLK